jgi:hypothetical protein
MLKTGVPLAFAGNGGSNIDGNIYQNMLPVTEGAVWN